MGYIITKSEHKFRRYFLFLPLETEDGSEKYQEIEVEVTRNDEVIPVSKMSRELTSGEKFAVMVFHAEMLETY